MSKFDQSYIESCPAGCQSRLVESGITLPEGSLRLCISCGLLLSPCSEKTYRESMREFDDPQRTWPTGHSAVRLYKKSKKLAARIEGLLGKRREEVHLLDVGCGSGAFVWAAKELGMIAEGLDPAAEAVNSAKTSGLKLYHGFLEDIQLPKETFDVVTLFEVIEHLKDPISLFLECHRIIRPGGLLIVRTGNTDSWTAHILKSRWEYFHIQHHGGHIAFFNPHAMRKLAGRTGFRIITIKTRGVSFFQKGEVSSLFYRATKIFSEILHTPSSWLCKGHEMLIFLRKPLLQTEGHPLLSLNTDQ